MKSTKRKGYIIRMRDQVRLLERLMNRSSVWLGVMVFLIIIDQSPSVTEWKLPCLTDVVDLLSSKFWIFLSFVFWIEAYLLEFNRPYMFQCSSNFTLPDAIMTMLITGLAEMSTFFHEKAYSLLDRFNNHVQCGAIPSYTEVLELASINLSYVKETEYLKYLQTLNLALTTFRSETLDSKDITIIKCDLNNLKDFYIVPKCIREEGSQIICKAYGSLFACLQSENVINMLLFLSSKQGMNNKIETDFGASQENATSQQGIQYAIKRVFDFPLKVNWLNRNILHMVSILVNDKNVLDLIPKEIINSNINSRDIHGCTPLHLAYMHHNKATVQFLKFNGAEDNAVDNFGVTPKSLGCRIGVKIQDSKLETEYYGGEKNELLGVKVPDYGDYNDDNCQSKSDVLCVGDDKSETKHYDENDHDMSKEHNERLQVMRVQLDNEHDDCYQGKSKVLRIKKVRSNMEHFFDQDHYGCKENFEQVPVKKIKFEPEFCSEHDREWHQGKSDVQHVDVAYQKQCCDVMETKSGMLNKLQPLLVLPVEEAGQISAEVKELFEAVVKNTYCYNVKEVVIAGSLREKLKAGRLDEVDVQIRFRSHALCNSAVHSNLVRGLSYISWNGLHLRPVGIANPWEFLWEGEGPSHGIKVSVDVVPVCQDLTYDASSSYKQHLIVNNVQWHKGMKFLNLSRVENGLCPTYFPFEWDILDSLPTECRTGILIAKALVQAYYWTNGEEFSPLKKPLSSYMLKTAVFYLLAVDDYAEDSVFGSDEFDVNYPFEEKKQLERLEFKPRPKWLEEGDLQKHGEKGRIWAQRIFQFLKHECSKKRLTYFWNDQMYLVTDKERPRVCEICDVMLERLEEETFY